MSLTKVATVALSMAFAATLAAAPQAAKPAAKGAEKTADQKTAPAKPAAAKPEMVKKEDLPKAVTDAIMKAHPKADITGATKTMKGTETWYKVSFKDGSKTSSMTLDANGMTSMPKKVKK